MRRQTAAEKKLADNAWLTRAWRRWHREELVNVLAGTHGEMARRLVQILRDLTLQSAPALLNFVRAQTWDTVDRDTRFILLHEIDAAINKLRSRNGMTPIDDPPDGNRLNVFLTIRAIVLPTHVAPSGANAGSSKS